MVPKQRNWCLAIIIRIIKAIIFTIFFLFYIPVTFYRYIAKRYFPTFHSSPSPSEEKTVSIATNLISQDNYPPYEDASPCSRCRALNLTDLTSGSGYAHCRTYEELRGAAEEGCKLCTLLMLAIERSDAKETASLWMGFRSTRMNYEERPTLVLRARERRGEGVGEGGLRSDLVDVWLVSGDGKSEVLAVVGVYAGEVSPAQAMISGRRVLCDSSAANPISLRKRWIKDILHADDVSQRESHEGNEELPKRVLDISLQTGEEEDIIKLVEVDKSVTQGKYIALSHCWGREGHFRLTESTLITMKNGLQTASLAKNFRDAIIITRLLGLRYLWIDALCILQDSQEDWELESAKMGQYYKKAWLTIAAGMSDGGKAGLLAKRSPHGLAHIRLQTRAIPVGEALTVYFALDPIKPSTQCPIRTRGWTFQEELLSRRYLSFETTQTYLRCGTIVHHECGRQDDLLQEESPFMEGEQLLQSKDWLEIVRRYSSRNLTKESDKLPALSGLAHEYCARWGGEYVAGLWKTDLWKNLLWRRNETYTLPEPKRPVEYRAPSWSWASLDGRIEFVGPSNANDGSKIQIQSVNIELKGSDPMGQVLSGTIEVRGIISKMDSYGNIPDWFGIKLRKCYDVPGEVRPEIPARDQCLLWICKSSGLIVRRALVRPDTESDTVAPTLPRKEFERVGYFSSISSAELDQFWSNVRTDGWHEHGRFVYPEVLHLV
ncbi:hypothetical protein VTL71DRAFT_5838 [Oculimacula yallundae]|uniref:Heterokaryon incompatibility domain-containing protein n=1 Tax=Oculimacula yallundae TaxID=86028 RepID=A0ABR4BZT3_9HELO